MSERRLYAETIPPHRLRLLDVRGGSAHAAKRGATLRRDNRSWSVTELGRRLIPMRMC
jgi:hypothetical protein